MLLCASSDEQYIAPNIRVPSSVRTSCGAIVDSPRRRKRRRSCPASLNTAVQNFRWYPYASLMSPSSGSGDETSAERTRSRRRTANSEEPAAAAVIPSDKLNPRTSIWSWLPTVISSSLRLRKAIPVSRKSSIRANISDSMSGGQGTSTPVCIPASAHARMTFRYGSSLKSRRWKRISSRPASASIGAQSIRKAIDV